jgi:hypothetical protein
MRRRQGAVVLLPVRSVQGGGELKGRVEPVSPQGPQQERTGQHSRSDLSDDLWLPGPGGCVPTCGHDDYGAGHDRRQVEKEEPMVPRVHGFVPSQVGSRRRKLSTHDKPTGMRSQGAGEFVGSRQTGTAWRADVGSAPVAPTWGGQSNMAPIVSWVTFFFRSRSAANVVLRMMRVLSSDKGIVRCRVVSVRKKYRSLVTFP